MSRTVSISSDKTGNNGDIILIRPLLDFMLIKKCPKPKSIITLDDDKNKSADIFEVLSVGPGTIDSHGNLIKPNVSPGDKIMLVGNIFEFEYRDKKHVLARANSVIAVVA